MTRTTLIATIAAALSVSVAISAYNLRNSADRITQLKVACEVVIPTGNNKSTCIKTDGSQMQVDGNITYTPQQR